MKNDYLGIMVWYASVKNGNGSGLQYAESWDASSSEGTIEAYIETGKRSKFHVETSFFRYRLIHQLAF